MSESGEMHTGEMSTCAAQMRKIKKPLIERRRRERINDCLVQLKALVLEAMNKDESRYSKMEKADILEMTVSHLRTMQRRCSGSTVSRSSGRESLARYLVGFAECASQVDSYLSSARQLSPQVRATLMSHLEHCLRQGAVTGGVVNSTESSTLESRSAASSPDSRMSDSGSPSSRVFSDSCAMDGVSDNRWRLVTADDDVTSRGSLSPVYKTVSPSWQVDVSSSQSVPFMTCLVTSEPTQTVVTDNGQMNTTSCAIPLYISATNVIPIHDALEKRLANPSAMKTGMSTSADVIIHPSSPSTAALEPHHDPNHLAQRQHGSSGSPRQGDECPLGFSNFSTWQRAAGELTKLGSFDEFASCTSHMAQMYKNCAQDKVQHLMWNNQPNNAQSSIKCEVWRPW